MQKKFKWGFWLGAVALFAFSFVLNLSLTSCSDDGGSGGGGGSLLRASGVKLVFDISNDEGGGTLPDACRVAVLTKNELPLNQELPIIIYQTWENKRSQKVTFSSGTNKVRLVVANGTGEATISGRDSDNVKAKKPGTFTVYAVYILDDTLLSLKTASAEEIMNYILDGRIDRNYAKITLTGVGTTVASDKTITVVDFTPSTVIIKAGDSLTLPTPTVWYSDGTCKNEESAYYQIYNATETVDNKKYSGSLYVSGSEKNSSVTGGASIVSKQIKTASDTNDKEIVVVATMEYKGEAVRSDPVTFKVKGSATVEEEKANPVTSVALTVTPNSVGSGKDAQIKAVATYRNGTTKDMTAELLECLHIAIDGSNATFKPTLKNGKYIFTVPEFTDANHSGTVSTFYENVQYTTSFTVVKGEAIGGTQTGGDASSTKGAICSVSIDFATKTSSQTSSDSGQKTEPDTPVTPPTPSQEETKQKTPIPSGKKAIFVKADSAPTLWLWSATKSSSELEDGKNAWPGGTMEAAGDYMNDGTGWFVKLFASANIDTGALNMHLNGGSAFVVGPMTGNALYWDGKTASATDPTKAPDPEKPTITISPSSGTVPLTSTITVSISKNLSAFSAVSITIDGASVGTLNDAKAAGSVYSVSKKVTKTAGQTIDVTVSATNGVGTTTASATLTAADIKEDVFTWDNIYCYFVLTDRFNNGDTSNDHSYGRKSGNGIPAVATFHGGDLKGLTAKIDYFDKLGVNAIWITAPYEQMHGWCDGKDSAFPHYAFHGYYTLDWTSMDANMGTLEEYRTFVNACHSKGIRVVMDVVMNHTGYNTVNDMVTYDFGGFKGTKPAYDWCAATGGKWSQGDGAGVDWESSTWGKWWGCWVRAFDGKFGFAPNGNGDICMSLAGLPDIVTERESSVAIPTFLKKKWTTENTGSGAMKNYANPMVATGGWGKVSAGDWRSDSMGAPADYLVAWLSAWVRELGIDGFRCDTAKHVHMNRWGQLKDACEAALAAWRTDASKAKTSGDFDGSAAANWTQKFWMTGECFGWSSTSGQGDYYSTGKFDSMINFSFNGTSGSKGRAPTTSDWGSYVNINKNQDSDGNGNRNSVLSYVSSHDTGLHRATGSIKLGTLLGLLPGGVQIYYGDESDRGECDGGGDADMKTRGDMTWPTDAQLTHWSKIGKFRKNNPAVGAGTGDAFHRTYKGNEVYIAAGNSVTLPSGDWWNWYTGQKVTGTSVTGSVEAPALISNKEYQ